MGWTRRATTAIAVAAWAVLYAGCSEGQLDGFVVPLDAGADARDAATEADAVDPTLGGPCTEDAQCDDAIPCTYDACDRTLSRCRNTPDDAQCADPEYCNGREVCRLRVGCVPGPVRTCGDGDGCTIDRCVEATESCEHGVRDADGDGDPDDHCVKDRDCDDTDPSVSSTRTEVCGNFKDDDCDGELDEQPCAIAANDTCQTALAVGAPGTFLLSSVAARKDYATTCSVTTPAAGRDIVLAITVPAGSARDVVVRAVTSAPSSEVAVALRSACETAGSELACGNARGAREGRAIARSIAAGTTTYAIVTTQGEGAVDVQVDLPEASTRPTNEDCASPENVALETAFPVRLLDATRDLTSTCERATGELTYAFTLAGTRDVRIFASTVAGLGTPVVSLRASSCTGERRCREDAPVFARRLPAGRHVFAVSATAQIDASVVVRTYVPPTTRPEASCASPLDLPTNAAWTVDLEDQEDANRNGCLDGEPYVAYRLVLTRPSDVLATARFGPGDVGAISLSAPSCAQNLACSSTGGTPARISKRNLPAGEYRIVVAARRSPSARVSVLVRPTIPPVTLDGDSCVDAAVISETGGFFTGTTAARTADFNAACDSVGLPPGGAKDQIARFTVSRPRRVVFDMSGSDYATLLSVRRGDACPGVEVENACSVAAGGGKSFLELDLPAATYWLQIDGAAEASGVWNLDVRPQ